MYFLFLHLFLFYFLHLCICFPTYRNRITSLLYFLSLSHPFVEGAAPLFLLADEDHTATTGFLLLLGFPQFHLEEQKESTEHDDVTLESCNSLVLFLILFLWLVETCYSSHFRVNMFIILTSTSTPLSSITLTLPLERGMMEGDVGTPLSKDKLQRERETETGVMFATEEYFLKIWCETEHIMQW